MIHKAEIRKIITVITAVLCIVVFTVLLFYARDPSLFSGQGAGGNVNYEDDFIKFMDVGQGDGAIIYSNGYCAVIDMGEAVAAKDVLADLNRLNVKQIDMLIASHYHTDHIGSFEAIAAKYPIKNMLGPEITKYNIKLAKSAKESVLKQGGSFYEGIYGLNFTLGEFKITVLGYCNSTDENERSLYIMAEIDDVKFLFTGDGEKLAEEKLLDRTKLIDCDVLKVAHHGSKGGTGYEFLKYSKPEYAVVSSGAGNEYGHPHIETLKALENFNAKIYRTDTKGDVTFYIDDGEIEIKTEKQVIIINIIEKLTQEFSLKTYQVENTVKLIDEGNTIPFIARYRKEAHGSLDDQVLRELSERLVYLRNMDETREKIKASIEEQGALTDELVAAIEAAQTLTELDDIYRPYKKKRKTRASVAKEKGLQPLADMIYEQAPDCKLPIVMAADFINLELGVETAEDALQGAMDIIAEKISDDADIRKRMRFVCMAHGILTVKGAKEDLDVYEMYKEYSEALSKIADHRILAINRGEKEEFLKVSIDFDEAKAMFIIAKNHIKDGSPATETVVAAAKDAYSRLIFPSIEREIRSELTDRASTSAIKVFSTNLQQLLMQPPVNDKVVLGLDPGYRTGCKVAVVDGTGKVLDTGVIYPAPPKSDIANAKIIVKALVKKHGVQVFAIGNGTASHETEVFAADVIKELNDGLSYMVVSEAGASVYSASKLAAEEFPDYDVSLRSAVSIARRLQDPLAELVKIDPKAIGVGQYQHDMPQNQLNSALDGVVEDCVNSVGVDLNTASVQLLARVSGLGPAVAKNVVAYREENGRFTNRSQLKKVSKLGPKAFEQCAGFLRIIDGKNPLDNTSVHPESYDAAEKLISLCDYTDKDLKAGALTDLSEKVNAKGVSEVAAQIGVGEPTLLDIIKELERPGRDPRDELPAPLLRTDIMSMEDLKAGMELTGTVRNVIDFGAFVDIGVHQDGLVHISHITNRFIKHPSEVLKVGDIVKVWVLGVDVQKKRISLTMRKDKLNEAK